MANVKISELTAASTPLAGTEVLPIVQSTATVKVSVANLTAGRAVSAASLAATGAISAASLTTTGTINNMTVGQGAGSVATNTAVGTSALAANTTGATSVAVGNLAAQTNSTGSNTTAVGYKALNLTTTDNNTAVGMQAGRDTTTGTSNVFVGKNASVLNSTGSYLTAIGVDALFNNTTAFGNTAVGYQAGYNNTTGTYGTYVGYGAGLFITTGNKNTIIGAYTGNNGGLDIRTATNHIVLSDGDGNPRFLINAAGNSVNRLTFDGNQIYPSNDNAVALGFSANRWTVVYATTGTINTSDENQKQDITSLDDAEKRVAIAIKSLIKKYRFKDAVAKKGDSARIHVGAVAQEVQAAFVAEGLDPARYALFCSDTWYEVNGKAAEPATPYTAETPNAVEVTQLGLRYEELLAFVIAAM